MIWLTWRQFRTSAAVAGAALLALGSTLAVTGPGLVSGYDDAGLPGCRSGCGAAASMFLSSVKGTGNELIFYACVALMYLTPALIGLFWGAPLIAREIESGTFRLAWNQSVTRARWAGVKLILIGCAAMLTAGLISLMIAWWASPIYQAASQAGSDSLSVTRLAPPLFGATGIVPLGYAALAFALGSAAGLLLRRTVPAMAVTLAVFAAIQVLVPILLRPHLIPPVQSTRPLASVQFDGVGESNGQLFLQVAGLSGLRGDWITGSRPVTTAGQTATAVPSACRSLTSDYLQCLSRHGIEMAVSYQPASRYWDFQWLETAIYLAVGAGVSGFCYWRLRRPVIAA